MSSLKLKPERLSLGVGSICSIYSRSKNKWFEGQITKIYIDEETNMEWLRVKYGKNKTKNMQRFCKDLRICNTQNNKQLNEMNNTISRPFGWQQLPFLPLTTTANSNIVAINRNEYVIATIISNDETCGIYKYNIVSKSWKLFIPYPKDIPLASSYYSSNAYSITFNKDTNELYLFSLAKHGYSILIRINLTTQYFKKRNYKYGPYRYPSTLIIDNKYHLFGGYSSRQHAILDDEKNKFEERHNIWDENVRSNEQNGAIYVSSQKKIYIFGGDIETNDWSDHGPIDQIWCHQLGSPEWNKLEMKLPKRLKAFGYVMTLDEKYVIFFGGISSNTRLRDHEAEYEIFVLDLTEMTFYECDGLRCPISDNEGYHAVIMSADFDANNKNDLMYGFMKNKVVRGYDMMIPHDIIHLMSYYFQNESICLIEKGSKNAKQWKIFVDDIFNSMKM